jgi:CBS domain-containing protein
MKIQTLLATKGSTVITVRATQSLLEVSTVLARHNIGALVVVDEADRPVGILSERDLIRAVARGENFATQTAQAVMTKAVIFGAPHDDVLAVMHTMTEKRFRHLPILEQGQLIGIISIGDLVKAQLSKYAGEVETLETQLLSD